MSVLRVKNQSKLNNESKSPILNKIFNTIERYRQTHGFPTYHNNKDNNCVLDIKKQHSKNLKSFQDKKLISCIAEDRKFSSNCCRNSKRTKGGNSQNNTNELIRRQEEMLLEIYGRLSNNTRKKSLVKADIDSEYERLQRKYCPKLILVNKPKRNQESKKSLGNTKKTPEKRTQDILNANTNGQNNLLVEQKSKWNFEVDNNKESKECNVKAQEKETLIKIDKLNLQLEKSKIPESPYNSDLTLVPEPQSDNGSSLSKVPKLGECKTENNKATSKYSTINQDLKADSKQNSFSTNSSSKSISGEQIRYSQLQKVFYHQETSNSQFTASSKTKKDHRNLKIKPQKISNSQANNKLELLNRDLRQAIVFGKSSDPTTNRLLANAIEKATKENFSWSTINSEINNIKDLNSKQKILHLVQIQLRQRVFILCTVRTCNFAKLLSILERIMQPMNAQFAPILQHFSHCCVIEAVIPQDYFQLNPKQLRKRLDCDAEALQVTRINVVNEKEGEVSVQCLPVSMPNITKLLESRGFKVLTSDYGFRANKEIILDTKTGAEYTKLINRLLEVGDIETISDNVTY